MADIERFWCRPDRQFYLDDGFLSDPNELIFGRVSSNPEAIETEALRNARAVVMLGEMGAGKTTVLKAPSELVPPDVQDVLAIDLALIGSPDEVLQHPILERWNAGSHELALVLDSFDEGKVRIPQLGLILANAINSWPTERLVLRIASRLVDWSMPLENAIEGRFTTGFKVVGLLPLRRQDARTIAAELCDEPDDFLQAVDRARAAAFASRPQSLRLLVKSFQDDGDLPQGMAALYERGTQWLASEVNQSRVDAGQVGSLSRDQRIAVARRVAAGITFGRSSAVWTGLQDDVNDDDLAIASFAQDSEPALGELVKVDAAAVKETLSTGLFTSVGPKRLSFAHALFGDYLTAAWIESNRLAVDKVRALLIGPDGRARPQLRVTAAWLVAINPDTFDWLAKEDPESFLGQVDLPTDELRAAVIDGLFADAGRRDWGWGDKLEGLTYDGIAEQVRPHITSGDFNQRCLAVKLVRDCGIRALRPELVQIVLDPQEHARLRTRAGHAVNSFESAPISDLAPLVLDESARGADEADELLAIGLTASWPHAIGAAQVFSALTPPQLSSYVGGYLRFIGEFARNLEREEVSAAISWLQEHLEQIDDAGFEELADAIVKLAGAADISDDVATALADIAARRAENYEGPRFGNRVFRDDSFILDPDSRRRLANAILDRGPGENVVLYLSDRPASGSGLLTADDLGWIVDQAENAEGSRLAALNRLFGLSFVIDRRDHVDLFLGLEESHPIQVSRQSWLQTDLQSEEAVELRKLHRLTNMRQQNQPAPGDDDHVRIMEALARIEDGDFPAFIELGRALTEQEYEVDLTSVPRWHAVRPEDHVRIVSGAEAYLMTRQGGTNAWLDDPSVLDLTSIAAYRALVLLLRLRPTGLDQLSPADWTEWAPVIAATACAINGPAWQDKIELLRRANAHAHQVLVEALVRRLRGASPDDFKFWQSEVEYLFDDTLEQFVLELVDQSPAVITSGLVDVLTRKRPATAIPILEACFSSQEPDRRAERTAAGTLLVDNDLSNSWALLVSQFDTDHPLALDVLGNSEIVRSRISTSLLPELLTADIYLWLRRTFGPSDDPQIDGFHPVEAREAIGQWRDQMLSALRDRGTAEAIQAIEVIANALPEEPGLRQLQVTAMSVFSQNAWDAYSVAELVSLARRERTALVSTNDDLQRVVVAALVDIQTELTGPNPRSQLLWDTRVMMPKSEDEVSDYLCQRLGDMLGENRLVVNREVQVRRNYPSGIPERTDMQIDAASGKPGPLATISLPVEVKGAWNKELSTSMRSQLADRYMIGPNDRGCYVVLWPDIESWDPTDRDRVTVASLDRDVVEQQLAAQARELSDAGKHVEVVHLDITYRRPTRS
jgi:hypothetical protein